MSLREEVVPDVVPLAQATGDRAGGKAVGLARLLAHGFDVPPGFVVCGWTPGRPLPEAVARSYAALGAGPVAVRSSAKCEDGEQASFAGQFESVLWVEGLDALGAAIERCVASLRAARAETYGRTLAGRSADSMAVVVQRMVEARVAGVAFSVDPVTMRRDRVPVEAVSGVGASLVAGEAMPDRYETDREGRVRRRETFGAEPRLTDEEVGRIARGAVAAERIWGKPLDLEWALDHDGRLWWLQARPITTPLADLNEFDARQGDRDAYVRFNIGEMLPGAICPLTLSTAVPAIDRAVQRMMVWVGTRPRVVPHLQTVCIRYGHVFFNMSKIAEFASRVAGVTRESSMHALCGRDVPEVQHFPNASRAVRLRNGLRYAHYILRTRGRVEDLRRLLDRVRFDDETDGPAEAFRELDAKLPLLYEAYFLHIHNSAASGFGSGTLEAVLAGGGPPTPAHEQEAARRIAGAGGVESADLLVQLERIVERLAFDRGAAERFRAAAPAAALAWLRSPESGVVGVAFEQFLARHGHRAFRELDLRQPGWADDPVPLVESMQAMTSAKLRGTSTRPARSTVPADGLGGAAPLRDAVLAGLARYARDAIRRREASKSLLVEVTHRFKRAYRRLGTLLARDGLLADAGLVFFLTHDELGRLALERDRTLSERAVLRRRAHEVQSTFEFPEVFVGDAEPLEPDEQTRLAGDDELSGKPVCGGVVEGPARVVRSFEEAAGIEPGEILIVSQTDVGWSPYYSLVSGLATDLGSPMSHGAVVAREYGLPAVTNLRVATRTFRTGDRVRLDGDRGSLRRADRPAPEQGTC